MQHHHDYHFVSYDGHKVLRIHVTGEDDRQHVRTLLEERCEIMKFPTQEGRAVDILCSPEHLDEAKEHLNRNGMKTETLIDDMGQLIRDSGNDNAGLKRAKR